MQPLIDGDVLRYEIGFAAETGWKAIKEWKEGDAPLDPPPFDYVAELLDNRITDICGKVMATKSPSIFLTGKDNFREKIATVQPYKGNREALNKPWHYQNITSYLLTAYNTFVVDGMEADDAMCVEQMLNNIWHLGEYPRTIICTRDKDLRQCPGWHFGWELGNQPQFGPELVEGFGYIKLTKEGKKLEGVGDKFFYAQLIMGDPVDNVPGIPRKGASAAFKLIEATTTKEEAEKVVVEAYKAHYGDSWREMMLEQGHLLWMVRELDENSNPVMWKLMDA